MSKSRTYLDYNATAPLLPAARMAMERALDGAGNPSSVHAEGRQARALIDTARRQVAALCNADPAGVVFTSGATEAAAMVLTPHFKMGRSDLAIGHLYVSAVEHPCFLCGGHFAADDFTVVPVDGDGRINLEALKDCLASHDTEAGIPMLALQLANNETGVIQPVEAAGSLVKGRGGLLVVDAVQAAGRLPLDMTGLNADFLVLSSHKIGGPKGSGALVCAGEVLMPVPLIPGGGQEKGHRSGTENPAAIAGFGEAAAIAGADIARRAERMQQFRDSLETEMMGIAPDCHIYAHAAQRLPNTSFFALPGLKAETAQIAFDLEGIAVSAGSACSSGRVGPSHVLAAMGEAVDPGGVRVSLGDQTTQQDVDCFLSVFTRINEKRERNRKEKDALV